MINRTYSTRAFLLLTARPKISWILGGRNIRTESVFLENSLSSILHDELDELPPLIPSWTLGETDQ